MSSNPVGSSRAMRRSGRGLKLVKVPFTSHAPCVSRAKAVIGELGPGPAGKAGSTLTHCARVDAVNARKREQSASERIGCAIHAKHQNHLDVVG
jgi:hypothetical protein